MNSTSRTPVPYLPSLALSAAGLLALATPVQAQPPSSASYTMTDSNGQLPPPPPPAAALSQPINQLMAPIALYPDPLIALILPASVYPGEVASASQYLSRGGDPNATDNFNWDDSVRALTHYPQILQWMSDNAQWTQDVGTAFASDPASVMGAIQQLRSVAVSSGTLVSTPQQQVVNDNGQIEIEPATENQIYVPSYDPSVVFVDRPYAPNYGYAGDYLSFGDPYVTGAWLGYGFNWEARALWYGDWREWHGGGGHGFRAYHGTPPHDLHAWSPPAGIRGIDRSRVAISIQHPPTPQPMRGAPPAPNRSRASYNTVDPHNQFQSRAQNESRGQIDQRRPAVEVHPAPTGRNDVHPMEVQQSRPWTAPQPTPTRAVEHTNAPTPGRDERAHPERPETFQRGPEHREPVREQTRAEATPRQEAHPAAQQQAQPHAAPAPQPQQHAQPQRPPSPPPEDRRDNGAQPH